MTSQTNMNIATRPLRALLEAASLATLLAIVACSGIGPPPVEDREASALTDAYELWNQLLPVVLADTGRVFPERMPRMTEVPTTLVIEPTTEPNIVIPGRSETPTEGVCLAALASAFPKVDPALCTEFVRRNSKPISLDASRFRSALQVVVLAQSEFDEIFAWPPKDRSHAFWPEFERRYPGAQGVLRLSLPAFSRDHRETLVSVGNQAGGLSGRGYLVWLRRTDGAWRVEGAVRTWIS